MVKIYRIEKDGWGLYSAGGGEYLAGIGSKADDRHPTIAKDPKLAPLFINNIIGTWGKDGTVTEGWKAIRFGFTSKSQLKRWVCRKTWRERLDQHKFEIGIYDAKQAIGGEAQAMFNMSTATKIGTLKLTEV